MIILFFKYLVRLPMFFYLEAKDHYKAYREKWSERFEGWGLHLYVGKFGAGKTCSMVQRAYSLAKRYPQLSIVTNLCLSGFPATVKIFPLNSPQDILKAPENTLVLIDEIGTIFNSRDFSGGRNSVPKILFQHLCQCRKRRMMILATTQRWNFLDKQLRDITATVNVTRSHFAHPFTRICSVYTYDAPEYDLAYTNPLYPISPLSVDAYLQTDVLRSKYDTAELINSMLESDYISDAEIAANRGEDSVSMQDADKRSFRRAKKMIA